MSSTTSNSIGTGVGRFAKGVGHAAYNVYIWITLGGVGISFFAVDLGIRDLWIARTIAISTGLLLLMLLFFFVVFAVNYSRKARYAEILPNLHEIHHALRNLQTEIRGFQKGGSHEIQTREAYRKAVVDSFQRVLTQLVIALSVTSGVSCRASIKLVGLVNDGGVDQLENLYVRTLARDIASAHSCADKDRHDDKKNHLVIGNTDFELLVKGVRRYFFSPNIYKDENYQNSSFDYWANHRPLAAFVGKVGKWFAGKSAATSLYPYVSVMTFPVKGEPIEGEGATRGIMGFLCIDTIARSGFWERYDANLGAAIADSLYHPLREYGLLMISAKKP